MEKICLLGVNDRAFVGAIRDLESDYKIFVVDFSNTYGTQIIRYKYKNYISSEKVILITDGFNDFQKVFSDYCSRNRIKIILPINDVGLEIGKKLDSNEYNIISSFSNKGDFAHNKFELLSMDIDEPIFIPKMIKIIDNKKDLALFVDEEKKEILPLVCKPFFSAKYYDNYIFSTKVSVIHRYSYIYDSIKDFISYSPIMLQKYYSGKGFSHTFLSKNGEILYDNFHERIHEPILGGGSSYRKLVINVNKRIITESRKLVNKMNWNGIGYLEYKIDKNSGKYYLMEMNGRPWGSIMLDLDNNFNYIKDFVSIMVDDLSLKSLEIKNINRKNKIIYERHLKKDLKWFKINYKTKKTFAQKFIFLKKYIRTYKRLIDKKEKIDDFRASEIMNSFFEFYAVLFFKVKKYYIFLKKYFLWYQHILILKLFKKIDFLSFKKIHFICKGNINRSPFAESLLKIFFSDDKMNTYKVTSSGTISKPHRYSPSHAIDIAKSFNVDLSERTSEKFHNYDESDCIFIVFDPTNYYDVKKNFSYNNNIILPITYFLPFPYFLSIIKDPHGREKIIFQISFSKIYKCLEIFLKNTIIKK